MVDGSQSPDGDFFDPEDVELLAESAQQLGSQSPDGDFFDPEDERVSEDRISDSGHSPLTGIFLIRSPAVILNGMPGAPVTVP